jgi:hypothetical protein
MQLFLHFFIIAQSYLNALAHSASVHSKLKSGLLFKKRKNTHFYEYKIDIVVKS